MRLMVSQQLLHIDIADAVAIRQHKRTVAQPRLQPFHPAAGICLQAGVDQMHHPIGLLGSIHLDLPAGKIDAYAAIQVIGIQEKALDGLALVAQGDHKFLKPIVGIVFHNMPQDRASADLDQRLWLDFGLFCKARAEAAG